MFPRFLVCHCKLAFPLTFLCVASISLGGEYNSNCCRSLAILVVIFRKERRCVASHNSIEGIASHI